MKEVKLVDYVDGSIYKKLSLQAINQLVKDGYELGNGYSLESLETAYKEDGVLPDDVYLEKEYVGLESDGTHWEVSVEDSKKIIEFLSKDQSNILIIDSKGKYLAKHHTCLCYGEETADALDFVFKDKNTVHYMLEVEPSSKGFKSKVIGKRLGVNAYAQIADYIDLLINPIDLLNRTGAWEEMNDRSSQYDNWGIFFALRMIEGKMEVVGCRGYWQGIES